MGARVKNSFRWKGVHFQKGAIVLLDMYGTNHDADLWDRPYEFVPERFKLRAIQPFDFLAQGGGEYLSGHRCPGEWITIETMKVALSFY
jgi:fatty-acid peroxygenase